ncbi:phytoene desaturase [Roseospira marina]|uniref:Phytoene dehydrogenase n=1 Tax=Roseospira marina TaxID=140057 RepID=A0A5M6IF59_9PROT|nr:phytoene desaturase [Roseospira marina]KAA5606873.1 phytoene desaturase [Roseospira marina]MBB4312959.1 phytoene desaturase [Roseospira marina]MBB5086268.1 phytoene desaturase [Roseospira marina]
MTSAPTPLQRAEGPGGGVPGAKAPHAVVIGAGFGGLAAAIRLGARGFRVTVVDRMDAPGGRAYVFRQDGFVFDAGPTIVTAPFLFEELWEMCGKRLSDDVELRSLSPFYKIRFPDGEWLTCSEDAEAMKAQIARLSPGDVKGYERFLKESKDIFHTGFMKLGHVPFNTLWDMAKLLPNLIRLRADRSVHAHVSRHFKDERLRIGMGFHPLFLGGNPLRATSIYSLVAYLEREWGVHFAMGGTGQLAKGMAGLIEGQGNTLRYKAEVEQIVVKDGAAKGVRLASGETIDADIVVSNADSAWTYKKLLPAESRKRWTDAKLDKARYSMSLFVWYFGTNKRYEDVPHHTILLGPRYQGLLTDIFDRHHLADDFSIYLHRPTATDPSMAPEGCDTFYALSPVPHLDSGDDWDVMAEDYRRKVEAFLEKTVLPGLGQSVVSSRMVTPMHFRHHLLSVKGAAFGLEPTLFQSAWFRPHNKSEDVKGLYLVGAGTHPGAGLPGVLSSARVMDTVVPDAAALV